MQQYSVLLPFRSNSSMYRLSSCISEEFSKSCDVPCFACFACQDWGEGPGHSRYLSGPLRQLLSGLGFTGQVIHAICLVRQRDSSKLNTPKEWNALQNTCNLQLLTCPRWKLTWPEMTPSRKGKWFFPHHFSGATLVLGFFGKATCFDKHDALSLRDGDWINNQPSGGQFGCKPSQSLRVKKILIQLRPSWRLWSISSGASYSVFRRFAGSGLGGPWRVLAATHWTNPWCGCRRQIVKIAEG